MCQRCPDANPALHALQVLSWLSGAPAAVEGNIRPGCVFLTLSITLDLVRACWALTIEPAGP
jgi:hypothetical protein